MVEKKKGFQLIQIFFARKDAIAPNGGMKVGVSEMKDIPKEEREELAQLCAEELGMEVSQ